MKKLLITLLCFSFLLCGCDLMDYTRDTSPGAIKKISYNKFEEMISEKETFIVMVSQQDCEHCAKYRAMLNEDYLPTHHVIVYELDLQNQSKDVVTMFDIMKDEIDELSDGNAEFEGTPTTLVFKKGELKECVTGAYLKEEEDDGVSLLTSDFDELIQMYKLDAKK